MNATLLRRGFSDRGCEKQFWLVSTLLDKHTLQQDSNHRTRRGTMEHCMSDLPQTRQRDLEIWISVHLKTIGKFTRHQLTDKDWKVREKAIHSIAEEMAGKLLTSYDIRRRPVQIGHS